METTDPMNDELQRIAEATAHQALVRCAKLGAEPDAELVLRFSQSFANQLRGLGPELWNSAVELTLPPELAAALPERAHDMIGRALLEEVQRHVQRLLGPLLVQLAVTTLGLEQERAARIVAESKTSGARRH